MKTPLPESNVGLARMLRRHCDRMDVTLTPKRTLWLLAWYYLNGYRHFDQYDPASGKLTAFHLDEEGNMEYQSQEMLAYINQVAGRIQGMDLRPKVDAVASTLGSIRQRALNQIVLDGAVPTNIVDRAKEEWAWLFCTLGFAGIQGHLDDHPTIGLITSLEVIHPKELYPFPVVEQDPSKCRGLIRQRQVPLDTLVEIYGPKVKRNLEKMEWFSNLAEDPYLENADDVSGSTSWAATQKVWPSSSGGPDAEKEGEGTVRTVLVRELWLYGPGETVAEYAIASGDYVLDRQDLRDKEVYCPIGWARFMNDGSWHGAGLFEIMFSQHRQLELMMGSLFDNVQNIDKYGVVVLPQGQMNQNQVLKDVGDGLRAMFWDPDYAQEGFKPFAISPFNSGDAPGKVAAFAREGLQLLNPIRDLAQEKGRVDSAEGLQFLNEAMTQNLAIPTQGAVQAWATCWRSVAQKISFDLMSSDRAVPVTNLTLDLAGAIIDGDKVSFDVNPVPTVRNMRFTVQAVSPKSDLARKQEILGLWKDGIEQDPMNVRMLALKEGLDLALYMDDIRGGYESSVRIILTAFNDGQKPGEIMLTPYTMDAEILMRLLSGFMKGPHMLVASDDVISHMFKIREFVMASLGLTLPNAVPTPEDMAVMSMGPSGPNQALPPGGAPQGEMNEPSAPSPAAARSAGPDR